MKKMKVVFEFDYHKEVVNQNMDWSPEVHIFKVKLN